MPMVSRLAGVREDDFGRQVERLLDIFGWTWKHDLPAMRQSGRWATPFRGKPGFPDYIAVRGDRIVCAELKSDKGRIRPGQKEWLGALEGTGKVEVYLWRPADIQLIADLLR